MNRDSLPPPAGGHPAPRWLQTALAAILGTALLVAAFFFAVFALIAAGVIVGAFALRWWWLTRKLRRSGQAAATVVEGEYRIVDREEDATGKKEQR